MIFTGIGKSFSTENEQQYQTIGAFWDDLSSRYGLENLRGLGYGWTDHSIEYVIGLKSGEISGANRSVPLPEDGWVCVKGRTENLAQIYDRIYQDGALKYEIETFTEDGDCEILYTRCGI